MATYGYEQFDEDELRYGLRYQNDLEENEKGACGGDDAGDSKGAPKRGMPHTRGTAMSFGFRRRPATSQSGIPVPLSAHNNNNNNNNNNKYVPEQQHQRSKSVGPDHESRRRQLCEDDYHQRPTSRYVNYSSSGRSTPRLAPPRKEVVSGLPVRTGRFGFRNQYNQARLTDKVADLNFASHAGFEHHEHQRHHQHLPRQPRPSPVHLDANRRELTPGRFTMQTSQLPTPLRVPEPGSSKVAKTAANQSRKVGCSSSGSGTEDSGLGGSDTYRGRPRRLGVLLSGKSFDVRDVDDDEHIVTEISVIPLPRDFAQAQLQRASQQQQQQQHHQLHQHQQSQQLVRERSAQYQRALLLGAGKDNRFADSSTSMSTTSSEGYDEGLGEEKLRADRSLSEKLSCPVAASSSHCSSVATDPGSPSSSDEHEFGHAGGEAMADEFSFASLAAVEREQSKPGGIVINTVTQKSAQHLRAVSNAARNGSLPNSTLRSVLLTIEDPAFAAVAATTTSLIDDETSPVDSLFDSPTASVSQTEKPKGEIEASEKPSPTGNCPENRVDDDSPAGTPTNASNSLSLSEGREFFDDEIADQPGLVFDETLRDVSIPDSDLSLTVLEARPKAKAVQGRSVENSPMHLRRINRAGSVTTLSSCESLASDDLMMDYERSDASSFGDVTSRGNSTFIMQDLDDATSLLELEIQGEEVMKEWNSLLEQSQQSIANVTNNNVNAGLNNNRNTESGLSNNRTSRLLHSRSSTDSPRSLDGRKPQVFSPLKPPRSIQSPSLDSGDESSLRLERGNYNHMLQDIVSIKTMLLQLKRVLQETDTLSPFDNVMKNGLLYNLKDGSGTQDGSQSDAEELADLRRQVVFLQGQVDEKERTIQSLQTQLTRYQSTNGVAENTLNVDSREMSSTATQTDKLRPISTGPSAIQSLSQDNGSHIASWSDSWSSHQQQQQHQASRLASPLGSRRSSYDHQHHQLHNHHHHHHHHHQASSVAAPMGTPMSTHRSRSGRPPSSPSSPQHHQQVSSAIPRRPNTLIPTRAARAVSASGRSPNS